MATSSYLISKNGLTNLKIAAPTDYGYYNLYIAVRNDWPELISIINKGLAAITPQQSSDIRNNWLSIKYEYGLSYMDILQLILLVIAIAGIIVFIIIRSNRLLQKEIIVRKKTETELKEAFENINTLKGCCRFVPVAKKYAMTRVTGSKLKDILKSIPMYSFLMACVPDVQKNSMETKTGITIKKINNIYYLFQFITFCYFTFSYLLVHIRYM